MSELKIIELGRKASARGALVQVSGVGTHTYSLSDGYGNTSYYSNLNALEQDIMKLPKINLTRKQWQDRRRSIAAKKAATRAASAKTVLGNDSLDYLLGDDMYANQVVKDRMAHGISKENALEVYVNSVEGDTSQLPPHLTTYAKKKGWLSGKDYSFD